MPPPPYSRARLPVYRIEHYQNLPHILQHGMLVRQHPAFNPNHVFIGNPDLTGSRHQYPVRPGDHATPQTFGTLGDYVPFYFGPRSPMLYNIITGWRGIPQRPQREIIYLGCRVEVLVTQAPGCVFTDGHAYDHLTSYYTNLDHLNELDWEDIRANRWTSEAGHEDRQRRKQAEFLVPGVVHPEWIQGVVVFDDEMRIFAAEELAKAGLNLTVVVNPLDQQGHSLYYYE